MGPRAFSTREEIKSDSSLAWCGFRGLSERGRGSLGGGERGALETPRAQPTRPAAQTRQAGSQEGLVQIKGHAHGL